MTSPLITLTTDFGDTSPYAAVMKGVILAMLPSARIVDLTHRIRPQDLRHANYYLGTALPWFPAGTVHVCVVDPGVGGERAAICVEVAGRSLLAPDNGILTNAIQFWGEPVEVYRLENPTFFRPAVSDTFHGRDVFAPAAAHLAGGMRPDRLGPRADSWVTLRSRPPFRLMRGAEGEVQFVDDFGNLITNIPAHLIDEFPLRVVLGGDTPLPVRRVRTYAEAAGGELVALCSSDGFWELAVVNGNAAERLAAAVGTPVRIETA